MRAGGTASIDVDLLALDHDRALGPAGQRRELDVAADLLQGRIEISDLVEAGELGLVGEQDVDLLLHQLAELARASGRRRSESDSVSAIFLPCRWAISAALRQAALASGRSQR